MNPYRRETGEGFRCFAPSESLSAVAFILRARALLYNPSAVSCSTPSRGLAMTNETWTDHASKALQGFLDVVARFLLAILPQVAVSLGLLLLCAILPSTLNLKLKLNIAYKS